MTSPNTIIADLADKVHELTKQRDALLAAILALKTANGADNFNGWHEAFLPAIRMANDAIAKTTGK